MEHEEHEVRHGSTGSLIPPLLMFAGLTFAIIALGYLAEVYSGIAGHTPHCAPISDSTVLIVFAFTATGTFIGIAATCGLRRRRPWLIVALLALVLNATALLTWAHWIHNEMLLPYDGFCAKVGMP